jgi:hypothetical protein
LRHAPDRRCKEFFKIYVLYPLFKDDIPIFIHAQE